MMCSLRAGQRAPPATSASQSWQTTKKEAEYLGHEAGRKKHRECDEIEVVGVMPVISARNAGKGRLCQRIPLKERALKFVKEAIKNGRSKID